MEDEWIDDKDDRNMMIGSSSSEGKMVIKLKIPKLPEQVTEGERSPVKDVIGKRVCLECNKEFSSGKALGGHMRIHVNNNNNNNNNNHAHVTTQRNPNFLKPSKQTKFKKTEQKPYYLNSVNEEGEPTCSLCGKSFPSMKSLFGHMRCHPERVWRGILPPPNTPSPTTPAAVARRRSGGGEVVDLMKFLTGWSVKERRGRKAVKEVVVDEGLLGAVEDLLSLANASGSITESTNNIKEKEEEEEELLVSYKCKKIKRKKKMKLMMELQQQQQQQVQEVQEQEEGVVNECKYKCRTCNKCFATHQALGGHRASHNKSKYASSDLHKIQEDDHESFVMMMMLQAGGSLEKGLHQCRICNKVFATGQALGGHKRCHWTGTIEAEAQAQAPSSQITSTGEGGSSGQKVLDFDLNEIPVGMMEEEEYGNADGYEYGYGYGYDSS